MKILLSLILLMSLPAFANNCHDAFGPDPEAKKKAERDREFKREREYWIRKGAKKTLIELLIVGAIGAGTGAVAGHFIGTEMDDVFDKKVELRSIEHRQD